MSLILRPRTLGCVRSRAGRVVGSLADHTREACFLWNGRQNSDMTHPRLVLFDMDDVLCAYDWQGRIKELAQMSGQTPDMLEASIWNSGFEDSADTGLIDAEAYLTGFASRLGLPFTRAQWVANRRAAMTPWPDMLALASAISRHATVAVLTNNGHLTAQTIDELFPELRPIFGDRILFSAQFGCQKPDPEVYRRAVAHLGFKANQTLFTDDRPENVVGAIAAGLGGHIHAGPQALAKLLTQTGFPDLT
jgi:glucose-1-phosphatase